MQGIGWMLRILAWLGALGKTAPTVGGLAMVGALIFLLALWGIRSIKIIGPTEIAILVFLGRPVWVLGSGPCFAPWPLSWLVRYPTKQYRLDYVGRPVITAPDEYPPGSGQFHKRAEIKVDTTVYFTWPRGASLIQAFQTAPPPGLSQVIFEHFEDAVVGAARAACGQRSWAEIVSNRDGLRQEVEQRLGMTNSPFSLAGINDIQVIIEEITLPERLRDLITRPEEAELERVAGEQAAQLDGVQIEQKGQAYRRLGLVGRLLAAWFALKDRGR